MRTKMKHLTPFICFILIGCAAKEQNLYLKKPAFYSYVIGDLSSKNKTAAYNENVFITPSSCQKTITALVAYKDLGEDYTYPTQVYLSKNKGEIEDVRIKFSGDPTLTSERLSNMLEPLKGHNIKGKIIIDASYFQTPAFSNNNIIDDIGRSYSAPTYSANLDGNLITVTMTFDKIAKKILIKNDANYVVEQDIKISQNPSAIKLNWQVNVIKATGNINPNQASLTFKVSPPEVEFYLLNKIKEILKVADVKGKLVIKKESSDIAADEELLTESSSEALKKILPPALKKSDNMVFDILYLTIINNYNRINKLGKITEWKEGDAIIKLLVKKYFEVDLGNALIVDGSGVSRYNRIQTKTLFELLKRGYDVKEFVAALPTPGEVNTTLEKRNYLLPSIHAKTGSMSGISCLCGYDIDHDSIKTFAIIANSFEPPLSEIYKVQDQFLNSRLR